jgi:hypothetical protein
MKRTLEIIQDLEKMEGINYSHYSAPKLCTKDARDRLKKLTVALENICNLPWGEAQDIVVAQAIAREALK